MTTHWMVPRRGVRRTTCVPALSSAGFDRFFDDVWSGFATAPTARAVAFTPRVDVEEMDDALRLTAELPGLDDKDFEVSIDADLLTLKGEKKIVRDTERQGVSVVERSHGSFERSFRFAWEIDPDSVKASYKQGVLEVRVAKPERQEARTVPVEAV